MGLIALTVAMCLLSSTIAQPVFLLDPIRTVSVCGETSLVCYQLRIQNLIYKSINTKLEEVDLSHTDNAVELGKLIPGSVIAEVPSSASMEGDEFWFWYGEGDPAIKRFNTFDETWTNLAGSTG